MTGQYSTRVGAFDQIQQVQLGQRSAVFQVNMPRGDADLQTWFIDDQQNPTRRLLRYDRTSTQKMNRIH
jgi:hypothetical protein